MSLSLLQTEFTSRKAHVLHDRNALRALLSDCLPEERAKVNQLMAAVDSGVLEEIQREANPENALFKQRMVKLIENEYGYALFVCAWVANVWVWLLHGGAFPKETASEISVAIPPAAETPSSAIISEVPIQALCT